MNLLKKVHGITEYNNIDHIMTYEPPPPPPPTGECLATGLVGIGEFVVWGLGDG